MIRVVVADDQALLRGSLRLLVNSAADLTAVGEAGTGGEAVDLAVKEKPDVILMDIRMPGTDGIEATRQIIAAPETVGTRVLVLTTFDLDEYVFAALRAGASGFLLKDTPPGDLLAAIRVIAAGDALLSPSVTRQLIGEFTRQPRAAPRTRTLDELTSKETEVLRLIGLGLSNAEICERLYVSMSTAKTHVGRLLMKLGARDRAQLVIAAYEAGLVGTGGVGDARLLAGSRWVFATGSVLPSCPAAARARSEDSRLRTGVTAQVGSLDASAACVRAGPWP